MLTSDALMIRNNYNIYFIFISKGMYEDAFLVLKSFIQMNNNKEALKELKAMETGSDNKYGLGIFQLSKHIRAILFGDRLIIPTEDSFEFISNTELQQMLRDYKCKMNIIMNKEINRLASKGMDLPVPPGFEIPPGIMDLEAPRLDDKKRDSAGSPL